MFNILHQINDSVESGPREIRVGCSCYGFLTFIKGVYVQQSFLSFNHIGLNQQTKSSSLVTSTVPIELFRIVLSVSLCLSFSLCTHPSLQPVRSLSSLSLLYTLCVSSTFFPLVLTFLFLMFSIKQSQICHVSLVVTLSLAFILKIY